MTAADDSAARYGRHRPDSSTADGVRAAIARLETELADPATRPMRAGMIEARLIVERRRLTDIEGDAARHLETRSPSATTLTIAPADLPAPDPANLGHRSPSEPI